MSPKILFYILTSIAVIFEVIGDVFFKKWADGHQTWMIIIGLIIYSIGTGFWAYSLRYEQLSKAIVIFTVVNLIAVVLLGVIMFGEKLTIFQIIGVILGLSSIILLEI